MRTIVWAATGRREDTKDHDGLDWASGQVTRTEGGSGGCVRVSESPRTRGTPPAVRTSIKIRRESRSGAEQGPRV